MGHLRAGIDVGSTTVKLAVLDADDRLVFHTYERHRADIRGTLVAVIDAACDALQARRLDVPLKVTVTGFRRPFRLPVAGAAVRPGGARRLSRGAEVPPRHRRRHRARRRGREDHVLHRRPRAADERHLRRRHRRLHRPDGHPAVNGRSGAERARPRAARRSTPLPRAAVCSRRPTCSRSSTRGRGGRTSRRASSRPW